MTIPKYCIHLSGNDFDDSKISCTGNQLINILHLIDFKSEGFQWYFSDINTMPLSIDWMVAKGGSPTFIGDTSKLISRCEKTVQFTSGIFLATPKQDMAIAWKNVYETEDEVFRDNEFSIIEIRAFDTSYFEIYLKEKELLIPIVKQYGCELIRN